TLSYAITARAPFTGETDYNILTALMTTDPVPPGTIVRAARGDLETICLRALDKDRERRYPTAAALADDLDRWLEGDAIDARPMTSLERLGRRIAQNRVGYGVGAGTA